MLAWTKRQIERGCLNSKLLSKSFLEFSRSVYEQEVGKGKGIKPMESFSLQTLTFHNEFPRLPPSTAGGENFLRKGTREALKARRGIQTQTSTGIDTAPADGWWPFVPTKQAGSSFRRTFSFCSSIAVGDFFCLLFVGLVFFNSKSIVSMDLKLFKFGLNQGYYNFQTQVSKLKRKVCRLEGTFSLCNCRQLQTAWHNLT